MFKERVSITPTAPPDYGSRIRELLTIIQNYGGEVPAKLVADLDELVAALGVQKAAKSPIKLKAKRGKRVAKLK